MGVMNNNGKLDEQPAYLERGMGGKRREVGEADIGWISKGVWWGRPQSQCLSLGSTRGILSKEVKLLLQRTNWRGSETEVREPS